MGTLYDRYGKPVYALILRIVSDPSTAEDVLAETFVKVWNQVDNFKEARGDELGFWILSLARNQAVERLRAPSAESPKRSALEHPILFHAALQTGGRPRSADPEGSLGGALACLDGSERRILELAYFQGLSSYEIGQQLALPLAKVKKSISGALEKLTNAISPT